MLYTFVPDKPFGSLLEICLEVWFTDQNSKPLEVVDIINLTLIIR